MRYLLIDKIKSIEFKKRIVALKNVALSEDFFTEHFVGYPVMPGALLIESAAQAATALLEISQNFKIKALLTIVEKAKFRNLVRPGDSIVIDMKIISLDNGSALLEGSITRDDTIVMDCKMVFVLRPVDIFYPEKTRPLIEATYNYWLEGAELLGFDNEVKV
jgi:3-hydroxyacyl-[acyl-carrier-protein] dehydratase